ncbi:MAG TPA: DEAD/DEAH box helicase [Pseudonocardiaceae bacterium]|nr:DEAD/DEAH box helicase [Pseudonocardiaceae bacterium]
MAVNRLQTTAPTTSTTATEPAAVTFAELGVPTALTAVLASNGINAPFPIQAATLPDSLAGRDVLGRGRTGSGKTYAFVLPVLARLAASRKSRRPGRPRALILAPTRELATQIQASIAPLAAALSLRTLTVFGGVRPGPQISGLRSGVDVLVACPGRLADHIASGHAHLDAVEITVLDEADHMADLGFLPVVRRLMSQTPRNGQRLLFSATLDGDVDVLVRQFLTDPITHSVDSAQSPVTGMSHHVLHVRSDHRVPVLTDLAAAPGRLLVFTRTKRGATRLTKQLVASGVPAVELHGNLAQNARTRNLSAFADGTATTLVATDIAARGIHIDDVALVIHADPPVEHKAYLHRSGRTARAGAQGTVVTLMTDDQVGDVRDLTRKAGITPITTKLSPGDPLLRRIAPGERSFVAPKRAATTDPASPGRRPRRGKPRSAAGGATKAGSKAGAKGGSTVDAKAGSAAANRSGSRRTGTKSGNKAAHAATTVPTRSSGAAAFSAGSRVGARGRGR